MRVWRLAGWAGVGRLAGLSSGLVAIVTGAVTAVAVTAWSPASAAGHAPVAINELHYNPADDDPASEFVELFNAGGAAADLGGWCVDGIGYCFPAGASIAPGGFLVLTGDQYPGGLSNSGEELELLDAAGAVVDSVEYDDHGEWPALADGEGQSLQRRNVGNPGSHPGNWESAGPTPWAPNPVAGALLPTFTEVEHTLLPPPGAPVHVTAELDGATQAVLAYRVGLGDEVAVPMAVADGVATADVPGQGPGALVRYRLVAESAGLVGTWPRQGDGAQYVGTTVAQEPHTALPTFGLYMPADVYTTMIADLSLGGDDGYPAVVTFGGQVFDNAHVRVKGQSSRFWPKKKLKVVLPPGYELEHDLFPEPINEFALHSSWSDRSFLRETLASELMTAAGAPVPQAFPARLELNGDFYGLYTYAEQPDSTYRDRFGFDESEVYEVGPDDIFGTLAPEDVGRSQEALRARYDKETFEYLDDGRLRDFIWLVNGLSGTAERDWIYANVDVPSVVNALAASMVIQHQDWGVKNYRLVFDPGGRVGIAQSDFDMVFGRRWSFPIGGLDANVYVGGAFEHPGGPLFLTFFADPELRAMIARRVRTIAEELLVPDAIAARVEQLATLVRPDAELDRARWGTYRGPADPTAEAWRIVEDFVVPQHTRLLGPLASQGRVAPVAQPAIPALVIEHVEYGGVQHVVVRNVSGDSVDLSGFTIPELDHTVPGGTVLLAGRAAVFVHEDATQLGDAFGGLLVAGVFDEPLDSAATGFHLLNRAGVAVAVFSTVAPGGDAELSGAPGRSALVSLVATDTYGPGFLQLHACNDHPGATSNVNVDGWGQTRSSLALAEFDDEGHVCLYNSGPTHLVADLQGYLAPGTVDDVADVRLVDTRTTAAPAAGAVVTFAGVPGATALVNLVATEAEGPGFLAVVPCAAPTVGTSNVNYDRAGATVASLAAVRFDDSGQACVVTSASAHVVVDLQAYLLAEAFDDVADVRLVDTRSGPRPGDAATVSVTGTPGAAALVSVVATDAAGPGFVEVSDCSGAAGSTSDLNYDRAGPIAVNTLAAVQFGDDGRACLYVSAGAHLVADLQGYFADGVFEALAGGRLYDSRIG